MKNTVKINSVDLINADCLHFIQSLPDDSIDLIVTDPPYFKVKPNGWDNQWKGDEDYLKWLDHCLAQFWRVLKPAGSLYLFCGHRLASDIEIMMRERFNVLNHIIWAKPSGRWNGCNKESLRAYFPATERVLFAEHYQGPYRGKSDGYAAKERELKQHIMAPLIAASINIRPGHNYYFYVRSVNTVGKSAFVEAVGQPSDDASGYLDFFKGEIGKTHLAQELWTQIDNGQLAPDLAEIRTSITDVSNEITQTVNKKLEDQSAAIQQIQKVQVDTNNNLNSMWAVKLQQMQDGRLYIAGIGAGIENTPAGMQSQVLLAADRIAMINPANGNTKPMFVGQGDQIFMNEVFLKYLTAPTITSGGNPPAFSLTPDGRLTAKNADISGNVNANSGTLNNVTINENCQIKGKLSANQIEGDIVKTVGKAFPRDSRAPERWPSGTITVRIYDDQPFDRQIVIPAVAFRGAKHERENNDIYSSCRLIVKKNGAEIYNRTALDNTLVYTGVIDMPAGRGHMTLEFSVSAWLVNDW
nr:DUF1983 domain-containing protein [Escherichia coli]